MILDKKQLEHYEKLYIGYFDPPMNCEGYRLPLSNRSRRIKFFRCNPCRFKQYELSEHMNGRKYSLKDAHSFGYWDYSEIPTDILTGKKTMLEFHKLA